MWRTFGAEVHESSIRVERWHNNYEILNKFEHRRLFFKRFPYQVQLFCIADYKEENRRDFWDTLYLRDVVGLLVTRVCNDTHGK